MQPGQWPFWLQSWSCFAGVSFNVSCLLLAQCKKTIREQRFLTQGMLASRWLGRGYVCMGGLFLNTLSLCRVLNFPEEPPWPPASLSRQAMLPCFPQRLRERVRLPRLGSLERKLVAVTAELSHQGLGSEAQSELSRSMLRMLLAAEMRGEAAGGGGSSNSSGDALVTRISSLLRDLPTLKAAVIVACAFTAFLIACLLLRVFRSGKRLKKTRKYDIITTPAERVEMAPLNEEDDEDEDSTVFDIKYR
ncbi:PREDICTED: membrane protein FAM174B [Bison bison bison]|uniref:Membrane protein FAM174B n=1 Tax=Bison bison bison TaxID=43346 RepID=A0A6P3GVN9_BISBB|nr:PREDICTED: membrane protein FAM174B [Bison bison bison]